MNSGEKQEGERPCSTEGREGAQGRKNSEDFTADSTEDTEKKEQQRNDDETESCPDRIMRIVISWFFYMILSAYDSVDLAVNLCGLCALLFREKALKKLFNRRSRRGAKNKERIQKILPRMARRTRRRRNSNEMMRQNHVRTESCVWPLSSWVFYMILSILLRIFALFANFC